MKPEAIKATGYLVSSVSVALLGAAAWPGAEAHGLVPALVLGMAASVGGMAMRWWSYELERRNQAEKRGRAGSQSHSAYSLFKSEN